MIGRFDRGGQNVRSPVTSPLHFLHAQPSPARRTCLLGFREGRSPCNRLDSDRLEGHSIPRRGRGWQGRSVPDRRNMHAIPGYVEDGKRMHVGNEGTERASGQSMIMLIFAKAQDGVRIDRGGLRKAGWK